MILYKRVFLLGKGISLFQYITALRRADFPNYVITIDKIPSTENYQAQIFFTAPLWKWGLANAFRGGVFLNKCKIQYANDEESFILQASPRTWNLVTGSIFVTSAFLFLLFLLFTVTTKSMLPKDIFLLVIFIAVWLTPLVSIYFRDKRLLDKIGSLAMELN